MKIPLHKIDVFTEDLEEYDIDPWYSDKLEIARRAKVSVTDVDYRWHDVIGETVIFVKGKYYGYASDLWDYYVG